ncbi:hypothetical protein E4U61_006677 [Claviceps capensis]|nr:hypothetical protein E4U61_006677 [Claviceps capensis]
MAGRREIGAGAARRLKARKRQTEDSHMSVFSLHFVVILRIIQPLTLGQSCRAWYGVANEELYKRDSREYNSFAIKWMAAHAVDEQTTDSALRTLDISRRWGGQIDAVQRVIPKSGLCRTLYEELYEESTALHFAVFLGDLRLTKTLLDIKASLEIPCSSLLWQSMGSEEVLPKFRDFQQMFEESPFDSAFPIFLAFLQSDSDMCKLLIEHGAGCEATLVNTFTGPKAISILHFAAADLTTDYRKWQCLFHEFRKYIDEPCPRRDALTPLHIALMVGCTQAMEMAVEYGADKEARDRFSRTPLTVGIKGLPLVEDSDPGTFDERKKLGASVNPEGDSVLLHAVRPYAFRASKRPGMRQLIYFPLEHHANIRETRDRHDRGVVLKI